MGYCVRLDQTGKCRSKLVDGWCRFTHPKLTTEENDLTLTVTRCSVCTLPLPCYTHFPTLGEPLDTESLQCLTPVKDLSLVERSLLKNYEILALEMQDQVIFAVLVEDKPDVSMVNLAYKAEVSELKKIKLGLSKSDSCKELVRRSFHEKLVFRIRRKPYQFLEEIWELVEDK